MTTAEDAAYAFGAGDFAFSGAATDDTLASVRIVTLPAAGRLTLFALPVSAGEAVTRADIDAGEACLHPGRQRERGCLRELHVQGRRRHRGE